VNRRKMNDFTGLRAASTHFHRLELLLLCRRAYWNDLEPKVRRLSSESSFSALPSLIVALVKNRFGVRCLGPEDVINNPCHLVRWRW
jgi:hypothetical protein